MKINYRNHRAGYTLIEFIFIIILIGILGAVAIPKLAATRDDARLAADVSNMAQCIHDAGTKYMAANVDMSAGDSQACDNVKCFNIAYATDGSDFTVTINSSAANYCSRVDELGSHLAKTYNFKGTSVIY